MTEGGSSFSASRQIDFIILYLSVCIGVGGLVRCFLKNITIGKIRFPYSAGLILIGVLIGIISLTSETVKNAAGLILKLDPIDLMSISFPLFIFKTAFQFDIHILFKSSGQIIAISTFGFIFASASTGFFMMSLIGQDWSPTSAILFGLLTSTTDTKETSKFLGKFKNLGILLAGEEMMVSSSSLFLYELIISAEFGDFGNQPASLIFLKLVMPVAIGIIIGKLFIYVVTWDQCDLITHVSISLSVSYSMFYSMQVFMGASGILTLAVFGMIICWDKQHITAELEHALSDFWDLLYTLSNYVLYIEAGLLLVQTSMRYGNEMDIACIAMTYLVCLVSRSLMFLFLSPLLSRIGYGFHWKDGVVVVWGALRGTWCLILVSLLNVHPNVLGKFTNKAAMYIVSLILMNLLLNGSTLQTTVKILGLTSISMAKIANMNNVLQYVISAKDRTINMLKMNRLFADADWDTVGLATKVVHPYRSAITESAYFKQEVDTGEDDDMINYRVLKCPDCQKEVPKDPTPKELLEMTKEAQLRVLKALKVSYWRQFEQGLLTKEGNQLLVEAVDNALDKEIKMMDLDAIKNTWKPKGCMVYTRNKLVKMMPKKQPKLETQPPKKRWRLFFYTIINSIWWEYIIFFIIIFNGISIMLDVVTRPTFLLVTELVLVVFAVFSFIFQVALIVIHVIGGGYNNYLKSVWNLIDVLTVFISLFYLLYVFKYFFATDTGEDEQKIIIPLSCSRALQMLRFIRVFGVIRASIPKIVAYLDKKIDVQLSFGYDVGKGFVTGEDEVLKLLPRIVDDKNIMKQIKVKMEADRLEVTKEIGILQRNRPAIAITVKTRQSMAAALHVMKEAVGELKDGGLLDDEDFRKLCEVIEERRKIMRKRFLSISPCAPEVLLKQVTWLVGDTETANFLLNHSLMVNLNYEEILIKANDRPQGLYIIISGLVRTIYEPNPEKLSKLEIKGALPNMDYPTSVSFRERQEDYIVSGNVIGELGILTRRTYDSTVICESSVQAYFISIDAMRYAMKNTADAYSGIELRMWKAVSVRLACIILMSVPTYQSWSQERIQFHLERSFVPNLSFVKTFFINDLIEAVLLIEGQAFDMNNKAIYFGPSYIPRTVQKLTFPESKGSISNFEMDIKPRLLIIPTEDVDEQEIIEFMEEVAAAEDEGLSLRSSKCLQHGVPSGFSRSSNGKSPKKRIKRNIFGFKKIDKLRPGVPKVWRSASSSALGQSASRIVQASDSYLTEQKTIKEEETMPLSISEKRESEVKKEKLHMHSSRKRAIRIEEDKTEELIEEEISFHENFEAEDFSAIPESRKFVGKKKDAGLIQSKHGSTESTTDVEKAEIPPETRYRLSYIEYESYFPVNINSEEEEHHRSSGQSNYTNRSSQQSQRLRKSVQGGIPRLRRDIRKSSESPLAIIIDESGNPPERGRKESERGRKESDKGSKSSVTSQTSKRKF